MQYPRNHRFGSNTAVEQLKVCHFWGHFHQVPTPITHVLFQISNLCFYTVHSEYIHFKNCFFFVCFFTRVRKTSIGSKQWSGNVENWKRLASKQAVNFCIKLYTYLWGSLHMSVCRIFICFVLLWIWNFGAFVHIKHILDSINTHVLIPWPQSRLNCPLLLRMTFYTFDLLIYSIIVHPS